nr:MAG TPA: hypothetical protein [Caudoviricetes sp.]DAM25405.1 MAG TPA: hypothetical protein [Caudoviricetes sp.]
MSFNSISFNADAIFSLFPLNLRDPSAQFGIIFFLLVFLYIRQILFFYE